MYVYVDRYMKTKQRINGAPVSQYNKNNNNNICNCNNNNNNNNTKT